MDRALSPVLIVVAIAALVAVPTTPDRTAPDESTGKAGVAVPGHDADSGGQVYVIHGAPGRHLDLEIDGEWLARLGTAEVAGPYAVDAGRSTVQLIDPEGDQVTSTTIEVAEDGSSDVVVHYPEHRGSERIITVFDNEPAAVQADKTSITVANTAALPPCDVTIDDEVLFAQIGNGEFADLVVPQGTYAAQIVPSGADEPVLRSPESVELAGGTAYRMYMIGDPLHSTVTFASHALDAPTSGSPAPDKVNTGTGGLMDTGAPLPPTRRR